MKLLRILFLVMMVSASSAFAQKNMPEPNPSTWVSDQADVLDDVAVSTAVKSWEKKYKSGVEFAVVTVKSLEDYDIADYSQKLFTKFGIGKKGANNGILILIAPNDRKMRIHTGYGIEAFVTDADSRKIQSIHVNKDEFRAGVYTPSVLRMIDALHEEIGAMSEAERTAWLAKQKAEETRIAEQRWNNFKDLMWSAFAWLLSLGTIGGVVFVIVKMVKRRRAAKKQRDDIRGVVVRLRTTSNVVLANHQNKGYRSIKLLNNMLVDLEDEAAKNYFWTSKIENHNSNLVILEKQAECLYGTIVNNLSFRDKIDEIAETSRKDFTKEWSHEPIVADYLKEVDHIDALDLDDALPTEFNRLSERHREITEIVGGKKRLQSLVNTLTYSDIGTTYRNHPEVDGLLQYADKILAAPLHKDVISNEARLRHMASDIRNDIRHREELVSKNIDFGKYLAMATGAASIIGALKLTEKVDSQHLDAAKDAYRKFDAIRSSDSVDSNWKAMKKLWSDIVSNLDKYVQSVDNIQTIQTKYNTALKTIPTSIGAIMALANGIPSILTKAGVSQRSKSDFSALSSKWSSMDVKPDGTVAGTLALMGALTTISQEFTALHNRSLSEHQQHVEEIARAKRRAEEEERKRRRRAEEEEESRRRNMYASSYSSSSSSYSGGSSSSSDSYGGGFSGGGGSSSDW
jgi:uncharacterized membrane protein YgcG